MSGPPDGHPTSDRAFALATLGALCVDLAFGGATRSFALSTGVAVLASLPLLVVAIQRLRGQALTAQSKTALALLAAIYAIPALQLIPLSPEIWARLPGRAFVVAEYRAAGLPLPWLPLSLTPHETWNVFVWLTPPSALLLATLSLGSENRRRVALAIPFAALAGVVLGMLQVLGGPESRLRFYAITNTTDAVGFFANRNHEAALLVVGLAFAPLWVGAGRRGWRYGGLVVALALEVVLVVGIGVTHSRAGVLLGLAVLAITAARGVLAPGERPQRRAGLILMGAAVAGAALVGLFARTALLDRFHAPLVDEVRRGSAPLVRHAAETVFPFGAGLGAFDPMFRRFEPLTSVTAAYFNHAHNDYLELALEAGLVGLAVAGLFIGWWLWSTAASLRLDRTRAEVAFCASVAIGALVIHSWADYPLRTVALASVFALSCGLIAPRRSAIKLSSQTLKGRVERRSAGRQVARP